MSGEAEVVLSLGEAARVLGVSPSGLRRLAVVYGEVYGEVQKDAGGTSRIWPREAVMRLQGARSLMAAERAGCAAGGRGRGSYPGRGGSGGQRCGGDPARGPTRQQSTARG